MEFDTVIIAHNIRSLWNIGSFFRTADALGVSHIHLTGYTAEPPRKEIGKTALGADEWIPWSKDPDPVAVCMRRKSEGYSVVALEIAEGSIPIESFRPAGPVCLIVGHEILGVPNEVLAVSDAIVHIPMKGRKHSLNVSVALGIALATLSR
jgi:tRNA G18 (ribose-2'-O)-methylase SpoU